MRDQFVQELAGLARRDPSIMLITGDLGFGVLMEFSKEFPKQFINAGVAEQNMIGLATGLALEGYKVFTYSIANFAFMRCLEQIRNDAAYHDANVKVVSIGGGFSYGSLGISHHATEDLTIMRSLPGVSVLAPSDCWEAKEATKAIADFPGTCYLRLDKSSAPVEEENCVGFQLGKARKLRDGDDITIMASGGIMGEVLAATDRLSEIGIRCRVLSIHTLKPLDQQSVVDASIETGGIITVEEHNIQGGLGGAVAEVALESAHRPRLFRRIGLRDQFSSVVGGQAYLRQRFAMDEQAIYGSVLELLKTNHIRKSVAA